MSERERSAEGPGNADLLIDQHNQESEDWDKWYNRSGRAMKEVREDRGPGATPAPPIRPSCGFEPRAADETAPIRPGADNIGRSGRPCATDEADQTSDLFAKDHSPERGCAPGAASVSTKTRDPQPKRFGRISPTERRSSPSVEAPKVAIAWHRSADFLGRPNSSVNQS